MVPNLDSTFSSYMSYFALYYKVEIQYQKNHVYPVRESRPQTLYLLQANNLGNSPVGIGAACLRSLRASAARKKGHPRIV